MQYKAVKLVRRPVGDITPDIFEVVTLQTPEVKDGEYLVRQTHMSLDPAMRNWLEDYQDSYMPPVQLGEVMRSFGIGEVVASKSDDFPVGSRVLGMMGWTEYSLGTDDMQIISSELPAEAVLCVMYLPGITAYIGLMMVCEPRAGETLVVTGAAGSVGSMVGQIAKAEGLRVIGTAGSDEKCAWLEQELGFDKAINYKTADLEAEISAAAPDGVDVFFENTGGPVQQVVFDHMNRLGRIAVCGVIADYNSETPVPGPNWKEINFKGLKVQGFVVPDYYDDIPKINEALAGYLSKGLLKYRVHKLQGLESAIDGINLLFSGENKGKLVVEL